GKRRLHKRPNTHEIERCKWWLDFERKIVKPYLIVAMGASAIRSVAGRPLTIAKTRGKVVTLEDGTKMIATIHPSYLLRTRDDADWKSKYRMFVRDLKLAA
ncbi:MAG: uracil-DNA glycosylase, partial [Pseudolabrys sp.]|nr:uracil-DNA glycosylase [Pseudolabrys sp.]